MDPFGSGSVNPLEIGSDVTTQADNRSTPEIDIWHVNDQLLDTDPVYKAKLLEATKLAADRAVAAQKAAEGENPLLRKFSQTLHTPITPFAFTGDLNPLNGDPATPPDLGVNGTETAATQEANGMLSRGADAVARGVLDAKNQMTRTAMELGAGGAATAMEHGLGDRSPEDKKAFFDWYKKGSANWTLTDPFTGAQMLRPKQEFDKWAGPQQGGVYGFIDDLTQFATASEVAGAGLEVVADVPVVGPAVTALNKTKMLRGGLKGVLAQMAAFDPYEDRISSMIAKGPAWFGRDAAEVLAPNKDDGPAIARIKNGLEGYLTGQAIEGVLFGLKIARGAAIKKLLGNKASEEYLANLLKMGKDEFPHFFGGAKGGPAQVVADEASGLNKVEVDAPAKNIGKEPIVATQDVRPTPGQDTTAVDNIEDTKVDVKGTLDATQDYKPRPLDFAHEPVSSPEQIKPTMVTIGVAKDGKNVIRAIEEVAGGKPKVFEMPFDDPKAAETVKKFRDAGAGMHTPAKGDYSPEEWKLWGDTALAKRPAAETVGGAAKPGDIGTDPTVIKQRVVESVHADAANAQAEAASFNMAVKNLRDSGKLFVDAAMRKKFQDALAAYNKHGDTRDVAELLKEYGFNTGYIQQPENVINTLKALVDQSPELSAEARGVPLTWAQLKARVAAIYPEIADNDAALRSAAKLYGGVANLPEHLAAMRVWMWHQAGQIGKLSKLANAFPDNAKLADQLASAMDTLFQVHARVTGATTKTAQTLNSLQMPIGELTAKLGSATAAGANAASHRAPATYPVVANLTRGEVQALGHMVGEAGGDVDKILKLIAGPKAADLNSFGNKIAPEVQRSFLNYVNAYRTEALLSSMPTQLGNTINNLGVAIKRPLQYFYAGAVTDDPALMQEGQDMAAGLVLHFFESAKLAMKAFETGTNIFDASSTSADTTGNLISLEASAMKNGNMPGNLMAALYKMPSRMLMTSDEFFKQLNGRAFMRAQILRGAREAGITDSKILAQKVTDGMKMAFDPNGGAIYPKMIEYAQDNTYTKELPPKLKKLMDGIGASEIGKFILPFRKTPTNIFLHSWEEAPGLNMLNKQMVDDLNAGGRAGALARAKADTGAVLWGIASWLALSGKITGSGPTDPDLRKQWMAAGNQPYSIRVAGQQFSYRRGDPFTSSLGVAADVINMAGELDDSSKASAMALGLTALANNVTNKTFMQTVSDTLDAIASGDPRKFDAFVSNAAGSLVPSAVTHANPDDVLRDTKPQGDGLMAELDNVMNAFMSRTPGFSNRLPPRRNIFGEKVLKAPGWNNRFFNPFQMMDTPKDKDVATELLKLGKAMPMPSESLGRLDLRDGKLYNERDGQSPYDRQLEMMASPPWGGKPLRSMVEQVVKSPAYRKAKDSNAWGPGGTRYMIVSEVISAYQQMARSQLLKEYPSLKEAMMRDAGTNAIGIMGGRPAAQEEMQKYDQMFQK